MFSFSASEFLIAIFGLTMFLARLGFHDYLKRVTVPGEGKISNDLAIHICNIGLILTSFSLVACPFVSLTIKEYFLNFFFIAYSMYAVITGLDAVGRKSILGFLGSFLIICGVIVTDLSTRGANTLEMELTGLAPLGFFLAVGEFAIFGSKKYLGKISPGLATVVVVPGVVLMVLSLFFLG